MERKQPSLELPTTSTAEVAVNRYIQWQRTIYMEIDERREQRGDRQGETTGREGEHPRTPVDIDYGIEPETKVFPALGISRSRSSGADLCKPPPIPSREYGT